MPPPPPDEGLFAAIADLPLEVESCALEGLEADVGMEAPRLTTLVKLRGGGEEGVGEDVTYDALDQIALQDAGCDLGLEGSHTLASFSERLEEAELFPAPPVRPFSHDFRRWAFESAALDLALRQAGTTLGAALGREPRPVTFVVSMRLGEPPTLDRFDRIRADHPGVRFKLDPTNSWDEALVGRLAETGAVDSLDFKGHYRGTPVDVETDPELYRLCAETFPDAWLEDPDLRDPAAAEVLEPHRDRITWDAPIHSVADIEALPFPPRMVNVKPSRFGRLSELFAAYDHCAANGISVYGGGQSELGPGRGQIQYLASLLHPDTPNDVAPSGYNLRDLPEGLPDSPLPPVGPATGFRWED